jgi:F-type H+-transporting ATPase subunit epsilon
MKTFKLTIVSPEGEVFSEDATQVSLPTTSGEITILPNHIPLVSALASGEVLVKLDESIHPVAIAGGFVQVKTGEVIILADFAKEMNQITEDKIEEAKKRAAELSQQKEKVSREEFEYFEGELERAMAMAKVHGKYKDKSYKKLKI